MKWRIILLLCGIGIGPIGASAGTVDRVAAVVNDSVIALSEVYDFGGDYVRSNCPEEEDSEACIYQAEQEVLDALVKRNLIHQELERLEMQVTGDDVDRAIEQVLRDYQLEDRQTLRAQVEDSGLSWEIYRDQLSEQLQVQRFQQRILAARVVITDDELKDFYGREMRAQEELQVGLNALGLLLEPNAEADVISKAMEHATSIVSQLNEGTLQWSAAIETLDEAGVASVMGERPYRKGELMEDLDVLVFQSAVGETLAPVHVGNVIFVVQVKDRSMGTRDVAEFKDAKDGIYQKLFQDKLIEAEVEWYEAARRQAAISIMIQPPTL